MTWQPSSKSTRTMKVLPPDCPAHRPSASRPVRIPLWQRTKCEKCKSGILDQMELQQAPMGSASVVVADTLPTLILLHHPRRRTRPTASQTQLASRHAAEAARGGVPAVGVRDHPRNGRRVCHRLPSIWSRPLSEELDTLVQILQLRRSPEVKRLRRIVQNLARRQH
jgi:hypothetical protein